MDEDEFANIDLIFEATAALMAAVAWLAPGDVLIIAGKGHETGQTIGDKVFAFSDLDVARRALQNHPP